MVLQLRRIQLTGSDQQRQGNRQIKAGALFGQIRWSQADHHPALRQPKAAVAQG